MSNKNAVANPLITQQIIPASDLKREDFFNHHERLNFFDLLSGFSGSTENTDYFLHHKGITFRDHVGRQFMTGNELLYYPELAKKLREISDYPILKRCYKVDSTIRGLEFLKYFYQYSDECLKAFQIEHEQLSNQVDTLIDLHGQKRYLPLIDRLELVKIPRYNHEDYLESQALILSEGVKWRVNEKSRNKPKNLKETEYLDLHRLFNISPEVEYLYLEDFVEGTPFIQVRLVKTWKHKGHIKWYSLDTCQSVSKAEVDRWKKPV